MNNVLLCNHFDNAIRWAENERLDDLFEDRCDYFAATAQHSHPAVIAGNVIVTYAELDKRANQLARYLLSCGVQAGDRVGLMCNQPLDTYTALLAILKVNAAYVPLDASFPAERLAFILKDADVRKLVSLSALKDKLHGVPVEPIFLDELAAEIGKQNFARLSEEEAKSPTDQLCYIIYTSGSTGNPKGVAVEHPSICNFVKVASEVYGYRQSDRVYQGMTVAFDFSVEEIWVPLVSGATLVPGISGVSLVGSDLGDFLFDSQVTALCCVPTLLASVDRDLPALRLILLSGEACPQDLVTRWYRPGRTILNAYGPTEATVTATITEVRPAKPVTIGAPLPTYSVVILDEHENKVLDQGALGEIGIAGIGLAKGYVNRSDLTEKSFIHDFVDLPNNPSKRIYRTGDLGRINDQFEIEYHGRIDTQVKIRGYRIELTEIESVLLQAPEIAQAVASTHTNGSGAPEVVAYCTLKNGARELPREQILQMLQRRLPNYMIPAYLELVDHIPMLPSNKADRKRLPPPTSPRLVALSTDYVEPRDALERQLADALASILQVNRVSVEDNFFTDLGCHSLLMARFSAAIKKRLAGTSVSMRDIYLSPTIAKLADVIRARTTIEPKLKPPSYRIPSNLQYFGCGLFQLLFYVAMGYLAISLFVVATEWMLKSQSLAGIYFRALALSAAMFAFFSILPILLKWILVGRWKTESFPIWGLRYFRFWVVKTLIELNPILLFRDTPLFNVYLRLLGARIGRNVVWQSITFPVCTDLVAVGGNTVLRNYSVLKGYRAESGYIHTGPVVIGENVTVGEASLIDINTVLEDNSQLGHSSTLLAGQKIPAGKRYHGSPAQECPTDFNGLEPRSVTRLRMTVYSALVAIIRLLLFVPIAPMAIYFIFPSLFGKDLQAAASMLPEMSPLVVLIILALSIFFFATSFLSALTRIISMPRIYNLFLQEGRTYVLYGFHYYLQKLISSVSNSHFFNLLFGDSSYIVNYLQLVGVNLPNLVQTGSNFGTNQLHDTPFLCTVGSGTMVSSRLAMLNAQFSSTSFKLSRVSIGDDNFLGNFINYPSDAKVGNNCLLATKVMVPIDGAVRENVGLLGSPSFEIPRAVGRDRNYANFFDEEIRNERLRAKNRFNLQSMASLLLTRWLFTFIAMTFGYWTLVLYEHHEFKAFAVASVAFVFFGISYLAFFEWASLRFKRLSAERCTILDERYWWIEHHWKHSDNVLNDLFKGTPFKNLISRLLGSKVGKKVFDDGYHTTERTLVEIGDYCTINDAAILQAHSLEDGIFKSGPIRIGKGCSIGPNALVHYGVVMADNSILAPDAFLMKGETTSPDSVWRGNPAKQV
jgi:non-ribosomal peptide synthetase-like protein